jgi:hypothetical protein
MLFCCPPMTLDPPTNILYLCSPHRYQDNTITNPLKHQIYKMTSTHSSSQITQDSRLPSIFQNSTDVTLITQGAEGLLFRTTFLSPSTLCALKVRPRKAYRHPTLDARLSKQRILAEARVLVKCAKEGVRVPGVLGAGWDGKFRSCIEKRLSKVC